MLEKTFFNDELNIELTSFIDNKQNIWFKGKDVAKILGYADTRDVIRKHVSEEHKIKQLSRQPAFHLVGRRPILLMKLVFMNLLFRIKITSCKKILRLGILSCTPIHKKIWPVQNV